MAMLKTVPEKIAAKECVADDLRTTQFLVFVAQGCGLVRVGDTAIAARLALLEAMANTNNKDNLSDEPILPIVGYLPVSSVGYIYLGEDEECVAYR